MNKKSKLFLVVTLLMITMMIGAAAAADDNNATHHTVDDEDAVVVKLAAHLVYQPCKAKPPHQSASHNADIAYRHFKRTVGGDERKLCKKEDKQEDDKRV